MKKVNPWAICHAQLGKEKTKKFERCVMKVKEKHGIKEGIQRRLRVAAALERGMKREVAAGDRPQPKSPKDLTKDELAAARKVKHAAESGMKRARAGGRMAGETQAAIVQSKRTSKRKESADIARATGATNDSTSYEGPSLLEALEDILEVTGGIFLKPGMEKAKKAMAKGLKKGSPRALAIKAKLTPGTKEHEYRQAKIKFAAKVRSFNRDRATGSGDETSSEETRAQRKARKTAEQNAREAANKARRKGGSENASTKYEGPSITETKNWIKNNVTN